RASTQPSVAFRDPVSASAPARSWPSYCVPPVSATPQAGTPSMSRPPCSSVLEVLADNHPYPHHLTFSKATDPHRDPWPFAFPSPPSIADIDRRERLTTTHDEERATR